MLGNMKRRGFTIIELIIVMAIIAILLALAVVAFRGYQASARDKEREADVQSFATYIESMYGREIKDKGGNTIKLPGEYIPLPSPQQMAGSNPMTNQEFAYMMRELPSGALTLPGAPAESSLASPPPQLSSSYPACANIDSCFDQGPPSASSIGIHKYIYRPVGSGPDGNTYVCVKNSAARECRGFTIYYVLESSPHQVRTIEGKHR